jgi:hypothetical protein
MTKYEMNMDGTVKTDSNGYPIIIRPVNLALELYKRAKELQLPITYYVEEFENDPQYVMLSPEEDYAQINKAMDNAEKLNRLHEKRPAIVAIRSRLKGTPQWYYIKTDLPNYRKKKLIKSKLKRKTCRCKK